MTDRSRAKVCHEVAPGRSAISFVLDQLAAAGVEVMSVVVGARAEEVKAEVTARRPGTLFAFQPQQLGTGHATWCGAEPLLAAGAMKTFLVAMGDKMMTRGVAAKLLQRHFEASADLTFAASLCSSDNEQGRVVLDDEGRPLGIVEVADLVAVRAWRALEAAYVEQDPLPSWRVWEIVEAVLPASRKVPPVLKPLLAAAGEAPELTLRRTRELAPQARSTVALGKAHVDPDWIESRAPLVNEALYVFSREALRCALGCLAPDNAQGEVYLTDAVALLRSRPEGFRLQVCEVGPDELASFNTQEELEAVRTRVASWLVAGEA